RIYHGTWGIAAYQSLYEPAPTMIGSLPQTPEWYLALAILLGLSTLSLVWSPLKLLLPVLVVVGLPPLAQACLNAARVSFSDRPMTRAARLRRWFLTAGLYLLQPLARLRGLTYASVPWRPWPAQPRRGGRGPRGRSSRRSLSRWCSVLSSSVPAPLASSLGLFGSRGPESVDSCRITVTSVCSGACWARPGPTGCVSA